MVDLLIAIEQEPISGVSNTGGGDQSIQALERTLDQLLVQLFIKLFQRFRSSTGSGAGSQPGSQTGGSSNTVPTVTSNNAAKAIADDLEQRYGLTPTQAAGVLGNFQQESGMQCNVNQGGKTGQPNGDCSGGAGWGVAQWDGDRKAQEIAYAREHHLDPGSIQANIGFMNQELDGPYNSTIRDIKKTNNVQDAALVWERDYEKAGVPVMGNREQYAENYLKEGL